MQARLPWPCLATLLLVVGCGAKPDPSFATPEQTIHTLLVAHGMADMSEAQIAERMQGGARPEVIDEARRRACFADYDEGLGEALAGFVFGTLALKKDSLEVRVTRDTAHVYPDLDGRPERSVVLLKQPEGWKISLVQSVPNAIRKELEQVYQTVR